MNIALIGSGGREHALCKKIYSSKIVKKIICFPGNAGTSEIAENVNLDINNFKTIKNFISKNFLLLSSKKRGELKASVTSSKNLTNDELKNLNLEISKSLGASINLDYKVDENLIGGLKMQIGSLMVDTSLKNKLKKYEKIMLEA